jgi:hypothetical protein
MIVYSSSHIILDTLQLSWLTLGDFHHSYAFFAFFSNGGRRHTTPELSMASEKPSFRCVVIRSIFDGEERHMMHVPPL